MKGDVDFRFEEVGGTPGLACAVVAKVGDAQRDATPMIGYLEVDSIVHRPEFRIAEERVTGGVPKRVDAHRIHFEPEARLEDPRPDGPLLRVGRVW